MSNVCPTCHNIIERCATCERCVTCSGCTARRCRRGIPELYRHTTFVRNRLRRVCGIEYEWATFSDTMQDRLLAIRDPISGGMALHQDRDGSVQPSEMEFITRPLVGDALYEVLTSVRDLATSRLKCEVNETCGLHVHVDASKECTATFRNFLYLYLKLERDIYARMCDPGRWVNPTCMPLGRFLEEQKLSPDPEALLAETDPDAFRRWIMRAYGLPTNTAYDALLYDSHFKALKEQRRALGWQARGNLRYCGLNFHALFYQGSLEWRMHEGTLDPTALVEWPLFCGWFTHLALTLPVRMLREITSLTDFARLPQLPRTTREFIEAQTTRVLPAAPRRDARNAPVFNENAREQIGWAPDVNWVAEAPRAGALPEVVYYARLPEPPPRPAWDPPAPEPPEDVF